MSRDLETAFVTELNNTLVRPIILFEGVFESITLRLWDGQGNLSWNSHTWLGNGWLQAIDPGNESIAVAPQGAKVILTGVPQSLIEIVLAQSKRRFEGTIYFGFLDSDNVTVIDDPVILFRGRLDVPTISIGPSAASITLAYENELIDLDKPKNFNWTNEEQESRYPGDRGFEYIDFTAQWSGFWGRSG